MSRGLAWLIGVVLVGLVVLWQGGRIVSAETRLPVLSTLGGDFALSSTRDAVTALSDFRGELVLLNFGYTSCPDVCPAALARMRDVLQGLPEDRDRIQPVFVTLDPDRDTLERIAPYVGYFDSDFVGMTGTDAQIAAAASGYQVFYQKEVMSSAADASELGYSISHSSQIYLLDEDGRVRATFGQSVTVPAMIETVSRLLEETS